MLFPAIIFVNVGLLLTAVSALIPSMSGYDVVFSDDFNGDHYAKVDHAKWDLRAGQPGAGNGELQTYRDSSTNAHLSGDGQLFIIPTKENGAWYSARLESWHASTCDPGKKMVMQAEIWVPDFAGSPAKSAGLWPAFWTKGESFRHGVPWPQCGEWDIFEVSNRRQNNNNAVIHFAKYICDPPSSCIEHSKSGSINYSGGKYHTWAFKVDRTNESWVEQSATWYLDGVEYHRVTGRDIGEYDRWQLIAGKPYYIILNMAVGGGFAGNPSDQTVSGYDSSMRVKYVATYKQK